MGSRSVERAEYADLLRVRIVGHRDQADAVADADRHGTLLLPALAGQHAFVVADHRDLVSGRGTYHADRPMDQAFSRCRRSCQDVLRGQIGWFSRCRRFDFRHSRLAASWPLRVSLGRISPGTYYVANPACFSVEPKP